MKARNVSTRFAPRAAALILLATLPLSAQSEVDATSQKIAAEALERSKAFETLTYLADNIGARPSGSKGAALAVDWTAKRFREWGITVRQEKVKVPHWVRGAETARLVSHNDQRIVLTAIGGSVATPAKGITADVIEATSYEHLNTLGSKVRGKIVFFNNPMDMDLVRAGRAFEAYSKAVAFRGSGASRAAAHGAAAVVIRSVGSAILRSPHTGALRYDNDQPKIPAAAMTAEDAMLVHRLLAKGEKVKMHLLLTPRVLPDVDSANVVAEIRGREKPEEIVLIGGHLDSWDLGTGAIDNGSGVAMVMDTMRILKQLGIRPRRTVRCVLFMNEEFGLTGARAYAAEHKAELPRHFAAIESDGGASAPQGFITTLKDEALERFRQRMGVLNRLGARELRHSAQTGADTSPLVAAGVPGFGLLTDPRHYFDYHHSPADTLDKVDPTELAQDTAAVAVLTWILAESETPLK